MNYIVETGSAYTLLLEAMAKTKRGHEGFTVAVLADGVSIRSKRRPKSIAEELRKGIRKPPIRVKPINSKV